MTSLLAFTLLALLSNDATLTVAQYVTTVTVSINTNPLCTLVSGIEDSGGNAGGFSGAGSFSGSGASGINGTGAGGAGAAGFGGSGSASDSEAPGTNDTGAGGSGFSSGSAPSGSASVMPIDTPDGDYNALGYYPAPADGNVLGGPVTTSPLMTVEFCESYCQGYSYFALENGDQCNCGSSPPSGLPSMSPPSKTKRQVTSGDCIPCAGNKFECCGAPGGYALVYGPFTPQVEVSSTTIHNPTASPGSVIEALSTSLTLVSSSTLLTSSSLGSNGPVVGGSSTTSYVPVTTASTRASSTLNSVSSVIAGVPTLNLPISISSSASTHISDTIDSSSSFNLGTSTSHPPIFASSSASTYGYSTSTSSNSSIVGMSTPYLQISAPVSASSYIFSTSNSSSSVIVFTTASTYVSSTRNSSSSIIVGTANPYASISASSSVSSHDYSTIASAGSIITAAPTSNTSTKPSQTGSGSSNLNMSTSVITSTPTSNMSTTPNASCVNFANYQGNNSEYTDYFGYTYDVRCNLDLQSAPTDHDAHADSFEDCLEYCSLLTDCAAVTYEDAPYTLNNLSNCHPKWDFGGYITSASGGVYSGVNVNGSSSGDIESQNLCTANNYQGASYNGLTYYDDYGIAWIIGCNNTLVITDSAALSTTVTDTLASCVDYCSIYDSCEMVNWTGPHANGTLDDPNCFPASAVGTADAAGSATGFGYAFVNNS